MTSKSRVTGRNPHKASRTPAVDVPRSERSVAGIPVESVLTPITEVQHLAEAAKRSGRTDRQIWVDRPEPQQLKTPNRVPGQWLLSGEFLTAVPELPAAPETPSGAPDMEWGGFDR